MAELLRYLGGFHATLSLLCPKEQGYKKISFADLISRPKSRN